MCTTRDCGCCIRAQPRFKNCGCPSFFLSLRTFNYSRQRRRGKRNMDGVSPPQLTRGLGSIINSPSGASAVNDLGGGRFMCNFVRFHASFSAFNSSLEMGDSYTSIY